MNKAYTSASVENLMLGWFPEYCSRPEVDLVVTFPSHASITIRRFHILVNIPGEWYIPVAINQLEDIDYSSGLLVLVPKVGNPVEIDLTTSASDQNLVESVREEDLVEYLLETE